MPAGDLPGYEGSHDEGDPATTNLYVGNLMPDIDEEARLYFLVFAFSPFLGKELFNNPLRRQPHARRRRGGAPLFFGLCFLSFFGQGSFLHHIDGMSCIISDNPSIYIEYYSIWLLKIRSIYFMIWLLLVAESVVNLLL